MKRSDYERGDCPETDDELYSDLDRQAKAYLAECETKLAGYRANCAKDDAARAKKGKVS